MSDEPTFPIDAVPGRVATPLATPANDAAKPAETIAAAPKPGEPGWQRWQTAGVAIGIGSAAVAAALLYANRSKKP